MLQAHNCKTLEYFAKPHHLRGTAYFISLNQFQVNILFHQGSIGPIRTRLSPMILFFLIGPSVVPRTTKTTTGRWFLIGYCFSTCLKQQPIIIQVPDPRRTEAIAPDLPPKLQCSARQCSQVPDQFRKNAADRPIKDRVLSGPKQSLVK